MGDSPKKPFSYPSIQAVIRNYSNERRVYLAKMIPSLRKSIRTLPIRYDSVSLSVRDKITSFRLDDLEWQFEEVETNTFKCMKHGKFIENISKKTLYKLISYYLKRNVISVAEFRVENFALLPDTISIKEVDNLYFNLTVFPEVSAYFESLRDIQTIYCIDIHVNTTETSWVSTISELDIDHVKINTIQRTPDDIFDNLQKFGLLEIKEEDMSDEKFWKMCRRFKNEWLELGCSYTGAKWVRGDDLWNRLRIRFRVDRTEREQFTAEIDDSCFEMFVQRLPVVFYTMYSVRVREYEEKTDYQKTLSRQLTEPFSRQLSNASTCLRSNWNTFFFTLAYFSILIDSSFIHLPPILQTPPLDDPDVLYTPLEVQRNLPFYSTILFIAHLIVNLVALSLYFRVILEIHRRFLSMKRRGKAVFEFIALAFTFCFFAAPTYFVALFRLTEERSTGFPVLFASLQLFLQLILETNRY